MNGLKFLLLIALTGLSVAHAGTQLSLESSFINNQTSLDNKDVVQNMNIDFSAFFKIKDNKKIYFGIDYAYSQFNEPHISGNTLSESISHIPFIGFKYHIGKSDNFSITLLYSHFAQMNYTVQGLKTDEWSGTAYGGNLSLHPLLVGKLRLKASIHYHYYNFNEKKNNGSTSTTNISQFDRNVFYPSVGLMYEF